MDATVHVCVPRLLSRLRSGLPLLCGPPHPHQPGISPASCPGWQGKDKAISEGFAARQVTATGPFQSARHLSPGSVLEKALLSPWHCVAGHQAPLRAYNPFKGLPLVPAGQPVSVEPHFSVLLLPGSEGGCSVGVPPPRAHASPTQHTVTVYLGSSSRAGLGTPVAL